MYLIIVSIIIEYVNVYTRLMMVMDMSVSVSVVVVHMMMNFTDPASWITRICLLFFFMESMVIVRYIIRSGPTFVITLIYKLVTSSSILYIVSSNIIVIIQNLTIMQQILVYDVFLYF